jgi:GNAT superfamily N-acetyltransferase
LIELLKENWTVNSNLSPEKIKEYIANNNYCFVALANSKIIGFICLHVMKKLFWGFSQVAQIEDLVVCKQYQHHGVGAALVELALDQASALGCYRVTLSCPEGLVPFYSRLGFVDSEKTMKVILMDNTISTRESTTNDPQ